MLAIWSCGGVIQEAEVSPEHHWEQPPKRQTKTKGKKDGKNGSEERVPMGRMLALLCKAKQIKKNNVKMITTNSSIIKKFLNVIKRNEHNDYLE